MHKGDEEVNEGDSIEIGLVDVGTTKVDGKNLILVMVENWA